MNALILVDLQNDFAPGGALPVPQGDSFIAQLNALQPYFDLVVATKDWHPNGHVSFASRHNLPPYQEITLPNGTSQKIWPDHCVQGGWGAEFIPGLETKYIKPTFHKGTELDVDSYSGFFDDNGKATGLGDYLQNANVDKVFVVGLATDYCVKATALHARKLGFETYVVEDLTRGVDIPPGDVARAIAEMRSAGTHIVQSTDVVLRKSAY